MKQSQHETTSSQQTASEPDEQIYVQGRILTDEPVSEPLAKPERIILDRKTFVEILDDCLALEHLEAIRANVNVVLNALSNPPASPLQPAHGEETVEFRRDVLSSDLTQILETHTLQRTHYYLARLRKGISEIHTGKINDINLNRWKEYDNIITDSLWLMDRRDNTGSHKAWYWGNFIPQIPHQMLLRYTQRGDWVLDTFSGSGTTMIECRRLGRNGLGVELNHQVVTQSREIVEHEPNPYAIRTEIVQGDSTTLDYEHLLETQNLTQVQLLIMHPPYHDIIRFSNNERDLSNATSLEAFVSGFAQIVKRTYPILEKGRYLVVVIGDKYVKGEWIPLGFHLMQAAIEQGYQLKSIIVKNFDETRAKREQKALWRYRALVGGFYVFKHEYILLLKKTH
ncbi:MAG: DNA methyltransferase [Anaerolineae bacterium]|nr:DNA methyltransferase [Anaerolineae bacterium]